jgi:hypothetical protein
MISIKNNNLAWHLFAFIPCSLFTFMILNFFYTFSVFIIIDSLLFLLLLSIKKIRDQKVFYFLIPIISLWLSLIMPV